ncbi:MAG: DUF2993 domain-containing protein [Leptolyngbyaceae cyanobacterium SM2_3_12]|nr:DUF2993 domain-containing protein [Leptolyngbyaceae cyanobacterium SM2_3_12]
MPDSLSSADEPLSSPDEAHRGGSRLISRLLPPAIRLWLQTQLDHIEGLNFQINGKDRQILSGYVPQVMISAQQAVYRGLHVSQVEVAATEIQVNLGQVVRGKSLRLLQPFPVQGRVSLGAQDLKKFPSFTAATGGDCRMCCSNCRGLIKDQPPPSSLPGSLTQQFSRSPSPIWSLLQTSSP